MLKKCKWCGKKLTGKQVTFCSRNHASTSAVTEWRRRMKTKALKLLGGECIRCGYKKCSAALTFHHREANKSFEIGNGNITAWEKVEKELKKCDILCRNCHTEEHHHHRDDCK